MSDVNVKEFVISLKGIKKSYSNGMVINEVIKGVDLDIYKGEFVILLGRSGCGKSAFLKILGGIEAADEGEIEFEGEKYTKLNEKEMTEYRRNNIGFVFEESELIPELNVEENVKLASRLKKDSAEPKEILAGLGLEECLHKYPSMLTQEEAQRVSVARALVKIPKMIILDEPTKNMDYKTSKDFLMIVEAINKKGITVVMATHNDEIAKLAERVILMQDGVFTDIIENEWKINANELEW